MIERADIAVGREFLCPDGARVLVIGSTWNIHGADAVRVWQTSRAGTIDAHMTPAQLIAALNAVGASVIR